MKGLRKITTLFGVILYSSALCDPACDQRIAIPEQLLLGQAQSQHLLDSKQLGWLIVGEDSYATYFPEVFEQIVVLYKTHLQIPKFNANDAPERAIATSLALKKIRALHGVLGGLAKDTQKLGRMSKLPPPLKQELRKKMVSLTFQLLRRAQKKIELPKGKPKTKPQREAALELERISRKPIASFPRELRRFYAKRTGSILAELLANMTVNGIFRFDCLAGDKHLLGSTFSDELLEASHKLYEQELDGVGEYQQENIILEVKNRLTPLRPSTTNKAQFQRLLRLSEFSHRHPKLLLISFSGFTDSMYSLMAKPEFQGFILVGPKDPLAYH